MTTIEADIRDIKGVLGRLEPVLVRMDQRLTGVEARLDRLEKICEKNSDAITSLIAATAELRGRVSQLPNTIQMLGFVLAVLAIAGLPRLFGGG